MKIQLKLFYTYSSQKGAFRQTYNGIPKDSYQICTYLNEAKVKVKADLIEKKLIVNHDKSNNVKKLPISIFKITKNYNRFHQTMKIPVYAKGVSQSLLIILIDLEGMILFVASKTPFCQKTEGCNSE